MTESYDFTTEDMGHMRREGSMRAFLRMLSGPSAGPVTSPAAAVSAAMPDDHVPGAWPAGTSTGAPGTTVCRCSRCTGYAADQPAAEDLLNVITQNADPESA